jgi:DNA-nicking Smr family endonuclease
MAGKRNKTPGSDAGHHSFAQLSNLIQKAGIRLEPDAKTASAPVPASPPSTCVERESDDPAELFARAMEGVERKHWRRDPAPTVSRPAASAPVDIEAEDERLFQEAIANDAVPPILNHPEYIEGWVGVAGQRFLPNLRNGVYSIQSSIDLHGLSRIEARQAVEHFLIRMSRERSCCVKIVHGRGINSPSDKAVLKELLQRWLATRKMSHCVLAYASAPYTDGGVGAIYVLLRRSSGKT